MSEPIFCYLCEVNSDGLVVPFRGTKILLCPRCVLEAIYQHPRLANLSREMAVLSA